MQEVKEKGPRRILSCFTIDEEFLLNGGETIYHNGEVIDVVTSGGFGYTIGKTIAYGYIPSDLLNEIIF